MGTNADAERREVKYIEGIGFIGCPDESGNGTFYCSRAVEAREQRYRRCTFDCVHLSIDEVEEAAAHVHAHAAIGST
jgi:hypothetical protein